MAAPSNVSRGNFLNGLFGPRLKLFISYRRRFDAPSARLLKEALTEAFGKSAVFRDVEAIRGGEDFADRIRKAIESSDVFLPLISPGWVESMPRLQDPADFVRMEIATALRLRVHLIPLLVGGAQMPRGDELPPEVVEMTARHAVELSDSRWDYDVQQLVEVIREHAARPSPAPFAESLAASFRRRLFGTLPGRAALALLVASSLAAAAYLYYARAPDAPPRRDATYVECLQLIRVFRPHESKVETNVVGAPVVGIDEYRLATEAPPTGLPLLVRLTESGQDLGAVSLRYFRGEAVGGGKFVVESAVEPPCVKVEDYSNISKPAFVRTLTDWDILRVRLRGREYFLRVGDHGDSLTATLTREPPR